MAPYSSTLAWKIPWTEKPGRLQSMVSLVGYNWATSLSLFTFMHWRRKWQPTPVFLSGNPRDRGAWWASVYGVAQSQTRLKWLSSNVLLGIRTTTSLSIYLAIFLSIHLGCFYVLAIMQSAAMNIEVHMSFSIMVSSGYICPVVGLLGHMVVLFLVS